MMDGNQVSFEKIKYEISTYIAILPDYKGFDWVFATNIK